jgi:hypothetical protein
MKKIILIIALLPFLVFAQDSGKKKAYYFYGDQCPHCKKVDGYFQANGIYEKYDITKLEFSNPFNSRLLVKFGDVFKDPNAGSVPAIAFGDKFIVGDQPIIDNFVREIDAAENASELPDPDKISKPSADNSDQEAQPANENNNAAPLEKNQTGNKNKYFPVILLALVLVGGGVLVYINRKPKE